MVNTNRIISSTIIVVALIAIIMVVTSSSSSGGQFFTFSDIVYGQSSPNTTTKDNTSNNSTTLPVLLIHGYMEDAAVWNKWVDLLKKDGIQIARRTVAKYRDVLKILPSSKRKKYF